MQKDDNTESAQIPLLSADSYISFVIWIDVLSQAGRLIFLGAAAALKVLVGSSLQFPQLQ